ncbi:MAG: FIG01121432: hypothetical protein, partial [uncultured Nocardioides sp.]
DLQARGRRATLSRARPRAARLGEAAAPPGAHRPADHHQGHLAPRRAAGRGLHVLRRPVRARGAVAWGPLPRGRPAPCAARGAAPAQHPACARARGGGV